MSPRSGIVTLRDGALAFKVLSAGRGAPVVYFHSFHEREGWSPFLDAPGASLHGARPAPSGGGGIDRRARRSTTPRPHAGLRRAAERARTGRGASGRPLLRRDGRGRAGRRVPARASRLVLISPLGLWRDDAPSADVLILPAEDLPAVLWRDPAPRPPGAGRPSRSDEAEDGARPDRIVQRRAAMAKFVWPIPDKGLRKRCTASRRRRCAVGRRRPREPARYAEEWQRRIKGAALSGAAAAAT